MLSSKKMIPWILLGCLVLIDLTQSAPASSSSNDTIPASAQLRRKRQATTSYDPNNQSDPSSNSNSNSESAEDNNNNNGQLQPQPPVVYAAPPSSGQRRRRQTNNGAGIHSQNPPDSDEAQSSYQPQSQHRPNVLTKPLKLSTNQSSTTPPSSNSSSSSESSEDSAEPQQKEVEVLIVPVVIRPRPIFIIEEINSGEMDTTTPSQYDDDSTTISSGEDSGENFQNRTVSTTSISTSSDKDSLVDPNEDFGTLRTVKVVPTPSVKVNVLPAVNRSNIHNDYPDETSLDDLTRRKRAATDPPGNKSQSGNDTSPDIVAVVQIVRFVIVNVNDSGNGTDYGDTTTVNPGSSLEDDTKDTVEIIHNNKTTFQRFSRSLDSNSPPVSLDDGMGNQRRKRSESTMTGTNSQR